MSFNPNEDWVLASTGDDNILQIWQPAGNILDDEGADAVDGGKEGAKQVDPSELE